MRTSRWWSGLAAAALLAACAQDNPLATMPAGDSAAGKLTASANPAGEGRLRVMTQNVFLGTEIDPVLGASSADQIPGLMAQGWQKVMANDFHARAQALAAEIDQARPHLVGLQEVSLFRMQVPGDFLLGNPQPATQVALDYLDVLLAALAERGLDYEAVAVATGIDIEVPMVASLSPLTLADLRYTDREVVLARRDLPVSNPQTGQYAAVVPFTVAGQAAAIPRAWASVDARWAGRTVRFVSTHLETEKFAPIQEAQGAELAAMLDALPMPAVVVGDFNSAADQSQADKFNTTTYANMVASGFIDVWRLAEPADPGYTCCHGEMLATPGAPLKRRIDLIFFRPAADGSTLGKAVGQVIGEQPADRTASGLWPSDHAGMWTAFRLQPARVAVR